MSPKKTHEFLTEVELEFMTLLWRSGDATVRDVLDRLAPDRKLAYTSAATILRILDEKGFVEHERRGNTLKYRAVLSKNAYQTRSLRDLSQKLFDDAPASLVARLVDDGGLSEESLTEIRELLNRRLDDDHS